jgi:hypothetical protein
MTKTNNPTGPRFGRYQNSNVAVVHINEYWNEATIRYVRPDSNQQKCLFKIGLHMLKDCTGYDVKS